MRDRNAHLRERLAEVGAALAARIESVRLWHDAYQEQKTARLAAAAKIVALEAQVDRAKALTRRAAAALVCEEHEARAGGGRTTPRFPTLIEELSRFGEVKADG